MISIRASSPRLEQLRTIINVANVQSSMTESFANPMCESESSMDE
jgi:hypothetical protein